MEGCVPANCLDWFRELLKEGEKEIHDNNPPAENRSYSAHEDSGSVEIFLYCCTMGSPLMF